MSKQRAEAIIKDVLANHLPRVVEGLNSGYVDENQILVIFDHAVRARVLRESVELHTMQLAAISTASAQNTKDSVSNRIQIGHEYWTVAYEDVCRAIDREITLRERLKAADDIIQHIGCTSAESAEVITLADKWRKYNRETGVTFIPRCRTCQNPSTIYIEPIKSHFCADCVKKIDDRIRDMNFGK